MLALTLLMFLVQWLREKGEDVLIQKNKQEEVHEKNQSSHLSIF